MLEPRTLESASHEKTHWADVSDKEMDYSQNPLPRWTPDVSNPSNSETEADICKCLEQNPFLLEQSVIPPRLSNNTQEARCRKALNSMTLKGKLNSISSEAEGLMTHQSTRYVPLETYNNNTETL